MSCKSSVAHPTSNTRDFFILPSQLFCSVRSRAPLDENLNETLEAVFQAIEDSAKGSDSEANFSGLFDDIDVNSNKLGGTLAERNKRLVKLMNGVGDMKLGDYRDNTIDAFGDAYPVELLHDDLSRVLSTLFLIGRKLSTFLEPATKRALEQLTDKVVLFLRPKTDAIRYTAEDDDGKLMLCSVPADITARMQDTVWSKQIPLLLTSGTLAIGSSFRRFQDECGLADNPRVMESIAVSPFDYASNCRLFFSRYSVHLSSERYYDEIAAEILRLLNQPVRELWSSVKEKSAVKAKPAEQRSLGKAPVSTEPSAPATTPTVQPSARTLPREKPIVFSPREPLATPKTDTTQFALPEIKTKEYIRSRRQKQNFLKEEANGIENITADSETFSPAIRTRETVREQQKLHVSHSTEPAQPALPQIRTRQPQSASMPANAKSVKPDVPQPPLPDTKSKQKYIAAQQPTQVTPVQANPQQAAREMIQGDIKLCKPLFANETAPLPTGKNAAPAKPVRVQKQVRPAVVRKQKIKAAPKAKIKGATPAAKALPSKASATAPKQAATVIRKGQALRDTAIKTAKVAKEAGRKVLRAIVAAAEKLVAAIGAGGAAAVSVVVVILLVGMLFASPLGILFAGEDTGTEIKIPDAVATLNGEFTDEIYRIMEDHPYDELDMQEGMEAAMLQNWRNVLAVYAVKVSTDEEHGLDVMTMDEEKLQLLREIFFDANKLEYPDGTVHPNGEITRAEFAAIAARFDETATRGTTTFVDVYGHWAADEIAKAYGNDWIKGYPDGTFRPDRNITRAEAITLISRVLDRAPESPSDLLPDMNKWSDNMDTSKWYYLAIQEATNSHDYMRKTFDYEMWKRMLLDPDWSRYER